MGERSNSQRLVEALSLGLLGGLFFQTSLFVFVFLVPVQIVRVRHGQSFGVISGAAALAAVSAFKLYQAVRLDLFETHPSLLFADVVVPVLLIGGLLLIDTDAIPLKRRLHRFFLAVGITGLLGLPFFLRPQTGDVLRNLVELQLRAAGVLAEGDALMSAQLDVVLERVTDVVRNTFLLGYCAVLTSNWYMGTVIGMRTLGRREGFPELQRFFLPADMVWYLVGSLAVALMARLFGTETVGHVAWNVVSVIAFLYALQGVGILWYLMERSGAPPSVRLIVPPALAILLFVPGLNYIVLLGLPGLGVSETWIHYKRGLEQEEP
ncbi:MAG: DUF2232 domain-containing protein [Spirochaetaceae bacterium]